MTEPEKQFESHITKSNKDYKYLNVGDKLELSDEIGIDKNGFGFLVGAIAYFREGDDEAAFIALGENGVKIRGGHIINGLDLVLIPRRRIS